MKENMKKGLKISLFIIWGAAMVWGFMPCTIKVPVKWWLENMFL